MLQPVRGVASKHGNFWVSWHVLSQPLSLAVAPCSENLQIHERIADVLGV